MTLDAALGGGFLVGVLVAMGVAAAADWAADRAELMRARALVRRCAEWNENVDSRPLAAGPRQ